MAAQPTVRPEDAALSLTMAMVEASRGPLLLLDGGLTVVAASASFRELSGLDAQNVQGRGLADLGEGEWGGSELHELLDSALYDNQTIDGFEMELRRLNHDPLDVVVHAERLVYLDLANLRLLVAVADVTGARADRAIWQQALKHSSLLLHEVRHRVANSLHLIATVLLRNARESRSEETKVGLREAHDRVMSVAAMERQLSGSGNGKVELLHYCESLCDNVSASMIGNRERISLLAVGPGGVVDGRVAVNVGLIVTELLINALKHAFPAGRTGEVIVSCDFPGPNWEFSVTDNGVGLAVSGTDGPAGFGATIIQALAQELGATVRTEAAHPGTRVVVTRAAIAMVGNRSDARAVRPVKFAAERQDSTRTGAAHGGHDDSRG